MRRESTRLRLLIFLTVGAGITVYTMAEARPVFAALALALWVMAWPVSLSRSGTPLPRPILMLALVAALAYAVLRALADTQDLVGSVSRLLIAIQLVKLYDRWGKSDRGLILAMSAFLAVGAVLTSNSLGLGFTMLIYLPLLMWATLQHGLAQVGEAGDTPARHRRAPSRSESRDLRRLAVSSGTIALGLAIATFLIMPRGVGEGFLGGLAPVSDLHKSGFNDTVTLGDAGLITESRAPVMDVVLRDGSGRNIGSSERPLWLRGAVLTEYTNGRWTKASSEPTIRYSLLAGLSQQVSAEEPRKPIRTIEVTMRHRVGAHLFTPLRPVSVTLERAAEITIGSASSEIRTTLTGPTRYSVRCQDGGVAAARAAVSEGFQTGRVRDLAVSLLDQAGVPVDPAQRDAAADQSVVEALIDRLRREYVYTTQMTATAAAEDPIEMFLFRTKEGHCEYFASGLTALCRSVGLPARVVTGYLASEFDKPTGAYLVRESNAHAWTEVQLSDGRWISVDASPPDDLAIIHKPPTGVMAGVNRFFDRISRWWVVNVVAFNEERRQALVGRDPLLIETTLRNSAEDALLPTHAGGKPILLIAVLRGVIAFAGFAAVGFAGVQAWMAFAVRRRARRAVRLVEDDDPAAGARRAQRFFYARALRALRRAGLAKPTWRPILDHAADVARIDAALGEALHGVGRLYYASRFGRLTLTAADINRAEILTAQVQERAEVVRSARRSRGRGVR